MKPFGYITGVCGLDSFFFLRQSYLVSTNVTSALERFLK